mmetsp:Transcript_23940/g.49747  ORF Transcript_23940/g.49747 Transcript_23940/m.49747 type:complete len:247 (+) Transcript_23940:582-1322(+)
MIDPWTMFDSREKSFEPHWSYWSVFLCFFLVPIQVAQRFQSCAVSTTRQSEWVWFGSWHIVPCPRHFPTRILVVPKTFDIRRLPGHQDPPWLNPRYHRTSAELPLVWCWGLPNMVIDSNIEWFGPFDVVDFHIMTPCDPNWVDVPLLVVRNELFPYAAAWRWRIVGRPMLWKNPPHVWTTIAIVTIRSIGSNPYRDNFVPWPWRYPTCRIPRQPLLLGRVLTLAHCRGNRIRRLLLPMRGQTNGEN